MEYRLPKPDVFRPEEWDWPFHKFCFEPEELFTTLHDRFNIHKLPLQDPMAFHRDICEAANYSATLEEFYSQMEERKAERIKEMNEAWNDICILTTTAPWVLACGLCYDPETGEVKTKPDTLNDSMMEKWQLFNYFSRSLSFDTLIRFFDGFVRDRRKLTEDRWRASNERLERFLAARRAAAAAEATETASQTCPEAVPESSHDASSSHPTGNKSRPSSPSGRHDAATPLSTTGSPMARKRKSDEDIQRLERKRRRSTSQSAGDDDDAKWSTAGHDKSEAEEPNSTAKQAEKRRRTDDSPDEQRNKRTRYSSDREEDSEYMVQTQGVYEQSEEDCSDSPRIRVISRGFFYGGVYEEIEDEDDHSGYMGEPQLSQENLEKPAVNDATTEATRSKKYKRKSQALHRQRAEKRASRKEHETSPPQKQPSQKRRQERKISLSVNQLLRSKRSSRRNPGQKLLFLADDATARVASGKRKI